MDQSDITSTNMAFRRAAAIGWGILCAVIVVLSLYCCMGVLNRHAQGSGTAPPQSGSTVTKRSQIVHVNDPYRLNARPNGPPPSLCDLPCKALRLDEESLYDAKSLGKGFIVPGRRFVRSAFRDGVHRLVMVSLDDLSERWQVDANVEVKTCQYVKDLDAVAFIADRKFIDVFDCATGRRIAHRQSTVPYEIHDFAITPDGAWTLAWSREVTKLAVANVFGRDGTEPVLALQNACGQEAILIEPAASVVAMQYLKGGDFEPGSSVAERFVGSQQVVRIVDLKTGQSVRDIKLTPSIGAIHPERFLDQSRIVVREGGLLSVVDWRTGAVCAQIKAAGLVELIPGTDRLFEYERDRVRIWDLQDGRMRREAPLGGARVALSDGQALFAVIRKDASTITFSTMQTCLPHARIEILDDVIHWRESLVFSPDGSLVMVLTKKGMRIIRRSDARQLAIITDENAFASLNLGFSETNHHLMTDGDVWELVERDTPR